MRYLSAGESHGPELTVIVDGFPSGLRVSRDELNRQLKRRQLGYGRGYRQQIESDEVEVTSGIRFGETLGSPITLRIANRDWVHWTERMSI
ncbi:MAG: chorismate synthase, partial [Alicyclobacillus sp.]|nr:chorismate synthase [Alicyclobacillus sp.]